MSFRCGTFDRTTGPPASSVPARIGNAAFFAPEILTSPSSGMPPRISSLSIGAARATTAAVRRRRLGRPAHALRDEGASAARGPPLLGRVGLQLQRVDLAADALAERAVNHLVTGDAALAFECRTDHDRLVVAHAVRADLGGAAGEVLLDQCF